MAFNCLESYAIFVWEHKLNFIGVDGKTTVQALTDLEEVCIDLGIEKHPTRIFHLEGRKIYWHIPGKEYFALVHCWRVGVFCTPPLFPGLSCFVEKQAVISQPCSLL